MAVLRGDDRIMVDYAQDPELAAERTYQAMATMVDVSVGKLFELGYKREDIDIEPGVPARVMLYGTIVYEVDLDRSDPGRMSITGRWSEIPKKPIFWRSRKKGRRDA